MRPLRWKGRYQTGDGEVDRRNRAFVECLNGLIAAAGQREHCQEMEDLIAGFAAEVERRLDERHSEGDLAEEFGRRLRAALPLSAYGGTSCRKCGLCDLAQQKAAEHFEASARCLFKTD